MVNIDSDNCRVIELTEDLIESSGFSPLDAYLYYGLIYGDELVQFMSFGKPDRDKAYTCQILAVLIKILIEQNKASLYLRNQT